MPVVPVVQVVQVVQVVLIIQRITQSKFREANFGFLKTAQSLEILFAEEFISLGDGF